jgi:limonene 1,2-monooxygenase
VRNLGKATSGTAMDNRHFLKAGIFLPPFHTLDEDPTLAIRRDLELIEFLEKIGFEEAWFGEHHSIGWEFIGSPELLVAAAAERTTRIRLGTGVISLPYHHPFTVADRIVQLDHQTRGRAMFGVGPGLLANDAWMMGIPVAEQRSRMAVALDVILRLLDGQIVTMETDWFKVRGARLQLQPYTLPRPQMAVASVISPSGAKVAGQWGLGMLCFAATTGDGFATLTTNWQIACETASANGHVMDRRQLRLVGPMHIAETREKAYADIQYGFEKYRTYYNSISPFGVNIESIEEMVKEGHAVIGTPDDAAAQLERLWEKVGEFGTYLFLGHNWADFQATKKSYELFARHTMPKFARRNRAREASLAHVQSGSKAMLQQTRAAIAHEQDKHARSKLEQATQPPPSQSSSKNG